MAPTQSSARVGADAIDFLAFWFKRAPEGEFCEVRPLNKRAGCRPLRQSWHSSTETAFHALEESVRNGDDLYIGVQPRRARGGKESDVGSLRWLCADLDFGGRQEGHAAPSAFATDLEVRERLRTFPFEPSMVVQTGGGFHAWWALEESAERGPWDEAMSRVVHALSADAAATDPPRILRVPGTVNFKTGAMRPVMLVGFSERIYALDDFLGLPGLPSPEPVLPADRSPRVQGDTPFNRANDVPVAEVLAWLEVEMHREGPRTYCACPVHKGKNTSQMVVGGRRNFATCFGDCGRKAFSPVDLLVSVTGVTPRDAVNLLATTFGFEGFAANVVPGPGADSMPAYESAERAAIATPTPASSTAAPGPAMVAGTNVPVAANPYVANTNGRARFEWIETADLFAQLPDTKWIVPALQICPGRPSMCAAYGSSGKTLAGQSMLMALAAGLPVWGKFEVPAVRNVRHIDHEQGRHATLKRYQRLARAFGIGVEHLEPRLKVTTFPRVYLNSPGAEEEYARACDGVDLVLLDALKGATPGEDENDSKIRECIDVLTRVSERTGCAFWLLHHAGKPPKKSEGRGDARALPRGSSAIFDACGSVWTMDGSKKGEAKLMAHVKAPAESEGGNGDDFWLDIEDVAVQGVPKSGVRVVCVADPADAPQRSPLDILCDRILEEVKACPGVSERQLRMNVGVGTAKLAIGIAELLERGRIVNSATLPRTAYRTK